jgi:hypothetical protein
MAYNTANAAMPFSVICIDPSTGQAVSPSTTVNTTTAPLANYQSITTNTTTVVKSAAGVLYGIAVTAIGTLSTLTVYDSLTASGTVIVPASIVTTALGLIGVTFPAGVGLNMKNGITVVTAGTTPASLLVFYA